MAHDQVTPQTIFDATVRHFAAQKVKSYDNVNAICRYRVHTGDGKVLKCAIGCHITDEEYSIDMERKSVFGLAHDNLLPPRLGHFEIRDILSSLQNCHDAAGGSLIAQNIRTNLELIGKHYKLSTEVLNEVQWEGDETDDRATE